MKKNGGKNEEKECQRPVGLQQCTDMYKLRIPEEERKKGAERISEEMKDKSFPVLIKKMMLIKLQV